MMSDNSLALLCAVLENYDQFDVRQVLCDSLDDEGDCDSRRFWLWTIRVEVTLVSIRVDPFGPFAYAYPDSSKSAFDILKQR